MIRENEGDKRDIILNATLKLITRNGFDATPMSAIAAEAGIAAGTIYIYFQNKETLINSLYRTMKARLMDAIAVGYESSLPVEKGFEILWKNYVRHLIEKPVEFRFCELFSNSPHINRLTKEDTIKIFHPVADLFEKGRKERIIHDLPNEIITALLFGPINTMVKLHMNNHFELTEEFITIIFKRCWSSVAL